MKKTNSKSSGGTSARPARASTVPPTAEIIRVIELWIDTLVSSYAPATAVRDGKIVFGKLDDPKILREIACLRQAITRLRAQDKSLAAAALLPDPRASALDCGGGTTPLWTPATGPNRQLPDYAQPVLIAVTGRDITDPVWIGFHDGEVWRYIASNRVSPENRVTHWMQLPNPPTT